MRTDPPELRSEDFDEACVFCREIQSGDVRIVGSAVGLRDRFPVTEGHQLVLPIRHVSDLFSMSQDEIKDVMILLRILREELLEVDPAIGGFNIGANIGAVAGQTIQHAHIHLIPRRAGDIADPRGGVRGVVPDRMKY